MLSLVLRAGFSKEKHVARLVDCALGDPPPVVGCKTSLQRDGDDLNAALACQHREPIARLRTCKHDGRHGGIQNCEVNFHSIIKSRHRDVHPSVIVEIDAHVRLVGG